MIYPQAIKQEKYLIDQKIVNLSYFINNNPQYKLLSDVDKLLLIRQKTHMIEYRDILQKRIDRI